MSSRHSPIVALLCGVLGLGGCKDEPPSVVPVAPSYPATRAARGFLHCVELDSSECIHPVSEQAAWDAFSLLAWLTSGSPLAILQAFSRELDHHRDKRSVASRFVNQIVTFAPALRGAACDAEEALAFAELVPRLRVEAQQRLEGLGMWDPLVEEVVNGLTAEAREGLTGGYLVGAKCPEDPWHVFIATAQSGERQVVVGMVPTVPKFLGGTGQGRTVSTQMQTLVLGGITPVSALEDGLLDDWIPIPVEEL